MVEIKGVKRAVGDYKRANEGGYFSPRYGILMFDTETGFVWCDEFYSLGHNEWKEYHRSAVINLGSKIVSAGEAVSMKTVRKYAEMFVKEEK